MAISLTAGMRSNLFALQQTANMMDQTQTRLATGKKVNSALDNPVSFFTAKDHMERADGLGSYKDGMGEAVQAIEAANSGIEGITAIIDSALAVAKSAKEADAASANSTGTITLSGVEAGDEISVGGQVFTASAAQDGDRGFKVGTTDAETAQNLAYLINNTTETGEDITADSVSGTTINVSHTDADEDFVATDVVVNGSDNQAAFSESIVAASDEKSNLVAQYASLMTQLDDLVEDSNYKGTNLLKTGSSNNLTVNFTDDHSMTLTGFDASASGLSLNTTATSDWAAKADAQTDIDLLEAAKDTLQMEASDLSSNLSVIKARQSFTDNMINTLETGADNLTLADTNEEGANMLMLQTRQALGTNSLSISAQSAQSVLRLF